LKTHSSSSVAGSKREVHGMMSSYGLRRVLSDFIIL
jgi:hypothetical protein